MDSTLPLQCHCRRPCLALRWLLAGKPSGEQGNSVLGNPIRDPLLAQEQAVAVIRKLTDTSLSDATKEGYIQ